MRIGRYLLESELGRGGMGVVYRCHDPELGRTVAVKLLLNAEVADSEGRQRFRREAKAVARLDHPGIVAVLDVGEHMGHRYQVSAFAAGQTMDAALKTGTLSPRRLLEVVRDLALALAHAHDHGVVHRDVKPGNVILDSEGRPRLIDFGLARLQDGSRELSQTGHAMGTPSYMAPEQAEGDPSAICPATDVYALGGLLYRGLCGRTPFRASSLAALALKLLQEPPTPPRELNPEISPRLEAIILRCLEKQPEERYASAAALAEDLNECLQETGAEVRPPGAGGRRWLVAGVAVMVALAAAVAAVAWPSAPEGGAVAFKAPSDPSPSPRSQRAAERPVELPREVALGDQVGGMDLVLIPPGTFWMGTSEEHLESPSKVLPPGPGAYTREREAEWWRFREVTLTRHFYVGKTEVTNAQFRLFKPDHDSDGCSVKKCITDPEARFPMVSSEDLSLSGDRQPVVHVTWRQARDYCRWLNDHARRPDLEFKLPTEAQWERVCRGDVGGHDLRWWGDEDAPARNHENLLDGPTYEKLSKKWKGLLPDPFDHDDGFLVTAPVASYQPNPLGVYDIYGNVFEWCRDGWREERQKTHLSSSDPFMAPVPGGSMVLKSGGFLTAPGLSRSGRALGRLSNYEAIYIGFRVVAEIVTTNEAAASPNRSDGRSQD